MGEFIAKNPDVVIFVGGLVGAAFMMLIGVITWLYNGKKSAETEAVRAAMSVLTEALDDMGSSLKETAKELFQLVRSHDDRLTRLEAQHDAYHGSLLGSTRHSRRIDDGDATLNR